MPGPRGWAASAGRQDGNEVARPAGEVLGGRADLAGDGGLERAARGAGDGELDPFGVDVEFHGEPRAAAGQRYGQILGDGGHARGVDEITRGVLAKGAAGDVFGVADGPAPPPP